MDERFTRESLLMELVNHMHHKFQLDYAGPPRKMDLEERRFRIAAMQEELDEYAAAKTLVEEYDALLDLLVFTIGTLDRQGLPLLEGFQLVMSCNMTKRVGPNGKRGQFKQDLVKPADFIGPETALRRIINDRTRERT